MNRTHEWPDPDGELPGFIAAESRRTLKAYREQPNLVDEHANHEEDTARGGYAFRQLLELVQNSADAVSGKSGGGRIEIRLTDNYLYCADDGKAIDRDGVRALMFSHVSPKRGTNQIGRFGLGFKSVLGVTDQPEFFSRSGSFRFDRKSAHRQIREVVPNRARYPALRLPVPVDAREARHADRVLAELGWATNIVRLPLKPGATDTLAKQMHEFPPQFLLFVKHVRRLTLNGTALGDNGTDGSAPISRTLELEKIDGNYVLADGDDIGTWKVFQRRHSLSEEARRDRRSLDDDQDVLIWWAVRSDRPSDSDRFWAYFPTSTASLVGGILNAPWKTNEDRQNLLLGPYNAELIKAAAELVADKMHELADKDDPARHLDVLPRRRESEDTEHVNLLRDRLFDCLREREIIPDQRGRLRHVSAVRYPPDDLVRDATSLEAFKLWEACPNRPTDWLHHSVLERSRRNRLAAIDHLIPDGRSSARIDAWLEALVAHQDPDRWVEASKAAIKTAASVPAEKRNWLGRIVLAADESWKPLNPDRIFLLDESVDYRSASALEEFVHPHVSSDADMRFALRELGIGPRSAEDRFRTISERAWISQFGRRQGFTAADWSGFWTAARKLDATVAEEIIRTYDKWNPCVKTRSGDWQPLDRVLLAGGVVPVNGTAEDSTADDGAIVDTEFHDLDRRLLNRLGVTDAPREQCLRRESCYRQYRSEQVKRFKAPDRNLPANPRDGMLKFRSTTGAGPLGVLAALSDEGAAAYTDALLELEATYGPWIMKHSGQGNRYPELECESPAVYMLRRHGRIRAGRQIVPFEHALGEEPESPEALRRLLRHEHAELIKAAFNLSEPEPEFVGEENPVPLIDVWPGLAAVRAEREQWRNYRLVRCERILIADRPAECVFRTPFVYLRHMEGDDAFRELTLVSDEAGLDLTGREIEKILQYRTRSEIEEQRAVVRACETDAERLLVAVGRYALQNGLPDSLLEVLESENGARPLTGLQIADAAIATYHTEALKVYRHALDDLDPPHQWAGSLRALRFVRSLGFSEEWAGERDRRRDPYLEVEGPYKPPPLHDYQRRVADNVRNMLRGESTGVGDHPRADGFDGHHPPVRRGMISLPTGAGKTRVAVQAVVEAICEDGFAGNVLWVADRDELCEQAVESWRQIWLGMGQSGKRLRVSRMWAGQPAPVQTSDLHVVVATVQTLGAKLRGQSGDYRFLSDFKLVVFDEAHRSIAPTFTSVMEELGLKRGQGASEPFLIGLTATPYRGYDEEKTRWLARRYGRNRLDHGAFLGSDGTPADAQQVIVRLQGMRVLARADHEIIRGTEFFPTAEQLDKMEKTPWWLPQAVEDEIGRDIERTKRILEAYRTFVDPEWPTLVFATSVEHAKTLAALLNARGIRSRSVSGKTETSTRRRIVEEFRNGDIKALVNYGVFREGFDAPKTRAIIVARPVYSPNLYFQMVGRGLRGTKNGGNDRCLVLDVQDNVQKFERQLAFTELDWLWES